MSITSVGASFGYIDPNTVAGVQSVQASADTGDDSTPDNANSLSQASPTTNNPPPAPSPAASSGAPKFAPETGSALIGVQEKANAA